MSKFPVSLKARLILIDGNRILLLRQTKPNGGNYSLVGGTVETFEFAKETLIRESYEEAGIVLDAAALELVHVLHKRASYQHRIVMYFKARYWAGEAASKELKKFSSAEWCDVNRLPHNLTPTVRQVLKAYRANQLYSEMEK